MTISGAANRGFGRPPLCRGRTGLGRRAATHRRTLGPRSDHDSGDHDSGDPTAGVRAESSIASRGAAAPESNRRCAGSQARVGFAQEARPGRQSARPNGFAGAASRVVIMDRRTTLREAVGGRRIRPIVRPALVEVIAMANPHGRSVLAILAAGLLTCSMSVPGIVAAGAVPPLNAPTTGQAAGADATAATRAAARRGAQTVHACASKRGGTVRIVRTTQGKKRPVRIRCRAGEARIAWRSRSNATLILGCIARRGGALRIVGIGSGPHVCKRRERTITWNIAGAQGAAGPQGPAGNDGAPGSPGAPGVTDRPGYQQTTVISGVEQADNPAVAIGADGFPIIVVGDLTTLNVIHCENIACTSYGTTTPSTGYFTSKPDIVIGSDGLPLIMALASGDVWATHCADLTCTTATSTRLVDAGNLNAAQLSVAVAPSGLPVFSYYYQTTGDLSFGRCANVSCTSLSDTTVVDASGTTGYYNSLTIGSNGLPFIAYYSNTATSLKTVACSNAACSAVATNTIDDSADTGMGVSVALGQDGMPVMSYVDDTVNVVRVAHCSNQSCGISTTVAVGTYGSAVIGNDSSDILVGSDGRPIAFARPAGSTWLLPRRCVDVSCTMSTSSVTTLGPGGFADAALGVDGLPFVVTNGNSGSYYISATHCSTSYCIPYQ